MPNVTVYNLTAGSLVVPGGYYVDPIAPNSHVTYSVPDTNEYVQDSRVQSLITGGSIRIEYGTDNAIANPLAQYTTATLPDAAATPAGTLVWNTTERAVYASDGTSWGPAISGTTQKLTADTTSIAANRFVGLNTSGLLAVSPVASERWIGVTTEAITLSTAGKIAEEGRVEVMPAAAITAGMELVCGAEGFAAPYQSSAISLGTTVIGADASDDIDQTNLPATLVATCLGNETGNTLVIYGDVGGTYTTETLTLGVAGAYTSTNTWAAIYCIRMTAAATGNIELRDGALVGLLIPQITAADPARWYGAIVPDVSTASLGHPCQISANGANASDVVLFGTDYAGAATSEVVTMNGTAWVEGSLSFRTLTRVFIGADGIAFNAGATSQYNNQVAANEKHEIRAFALEAEATPGATVACLLLPQNLGIVQGEFPAPYHASQTTWAGGGATTTVTVNGVLATDVIQCTMNAVTAAERIILVARTAADTVTVTYSGVPGASTFSLLVYRP